MAELHISEPQPNGISTPSSSAAAAGTPVIAKSETLGKKRQRRPSVRLGDIGGSDLQYHFEGSAASNPRRGNSGGKFNLSNQSHQAEHKRDGVSKVQSRTRALTNLTAEKETLEEKELSLDAAAVGSWRGKDSKKRIFIPNITSRRARSGWGKEPKFDDTGGGGSGGGTGNNGLDGGDDKYSGGEDMEGEDGGYNGRSFNPENSDSPLEEENMDGIHMSPTENLGDGNERYGKLLYYDNRGIGGYGRYSNQYHHHEGVEFSGPSDNDGREYGNNAAGCSGGGGEDGVKIWLNSIGLGRYAPVFEVHEVDDEVLPMLTLEDLKDMGISAVGSRRKMFCAIQKLGRGFS